MSKEENFTQIEVIQYDGMTWASVYDLVQWLKDLHGEFDSDMQTQLLSTQISQLTRLVTK